MKGTLGKGKDMLAEKFEQGKVVLQKKVEASKIKEKAGEAVSSGQDVLKKKIHHGKEFAQEAFSSGAEAAKERLIIGKDVLKEKLGESGQTFKQKAGEYSGYAAETLKQATKQVGGVAGSAYDSVKSAPEAITNKATKYTRRMALYGIGGLTLVAFAFAAGNKLPQAYFDYQLKKQELEAQNKSNEQVPNTK